MIDYQVFLDCRSEIDRIIDPEKLRFENTIKTKKRSNCFWIAFPSKLRFENTIKTKKRSSVLGVFSFNCIYS